MFCEVAERPGELLSKDHVKVANGIRCIMENEFRIVPPPREAKIEILLADDLFRRRAVTHAKNIASDLQYKIEGEAFTSAMGLKIFRCSIYSDDLMPGILVYWEDSGGKKQSSVYFGGYNDTDDEVTA